MHPSFPVSGNVISVMLLLFQEMMPLSLTKKHLITTLPELSHEIHSLWDTGRVTQTTPLISATITKRKAKGPFRAQSEIVN